MATADEATGLLAAALALGIDTVDTAPGYGAAEDTIGAGPPSLRVHTKVDPAMEPGSSLEGSLRRLRRDHVDVLYLHDSREVLRSASTVIAAAHALVGDRVGRLGASVYDPDELEAALADPRIQAVQVPLNVFDRRVGEPHLQKAAAQGVEVYARSALLQGLLAGPSTSLPSSVAPLQPFVRAFEALACDLGRSCLELALGWVRATPGLHGVVVGAGSTEELRVTVDALRRPPLTPQELAGLGALPLPPVALVDPRRWPLVRG